jgi:putative ABC transport system substrate-binding protein
MLVIGFLSSASSEGYGHLAAAFRQGLGESGFVEDRNVAIEYRRADDRRERLPALGVQALELPPTFQRAFLGRTKIWPG